METHQPQGGVTPWRRIGSSAYWVKVISARGANGASDGCVLTGRREYGDGQPGLYSLYQSRVEVAVMDRRSGKKPRVRAFAQPAGRSVEQRPMKRRRGWGEGGGALRVFGFQAQQGCFQELHRTGENILHPWGEHARPCKHQDPEEKQ